MLLGQLFPVLRAVPAIARARRGELSADPTARRLEAFAALIDLLRTLAEERTLLLVIDDLQWADAESFRLLLALAEHPSPPPMMIVATIRPREELESEVADGLEAVRRKQRIDVVQILGLPEQPAAALARSLLGSEAREEFCLAIAAESAGHPLFLSELVRFVQSQDVPVRRSLTIEAALRARIERLDERARELLEVVAVAGRPYGSHVFAAALGRTSIDEPARALLLAKLLRIRKGPELDCFHDRIRHAVSGLIASGRLAALHSKLAAALSAEVNADAVEQAHHWDLGGDSERAADAYERAADAALSALAFARAAALSGRALELVGREDVVRTQRLLEQSAYALACMGRSPESATLYARAIELASGQKRYELRERHAHQLIVSGKLDLGIGLMRSLLDELGVKLPTTMLGSVLHIMGHRVWLALRGENFHPRAARPGEEQGVFTNDVLGNFAMAVSPVHPLELFVVTFNAVRVAARVPVRETFVRLYATLGWLRALRGAPKPSLFEKSRMLAAEITAPAVIANGQFIEGSAHLVGWNFKAAAVCLEQAQHTLQTRCPNQPWLLRNVRYHLGLPWYALGEHRRVAEETERWIAEARERNDQLSIALLSGMGYGFVRHLMRDEPDAALAEMEGALRTLPKAPFSFVHFGELIATVNALLYKGGAEAHAWLEARARHHGRQLLLKSPNGRATLDLYGGLAALHALGSCGPRQQGRLTERARKAAKRLSKCASPLMRVYGRLLLAQVHAVQGKITDALTCAEEAARIAPDFAEYQKRLAIYLEAMIETRHQNEPRCQAVVQSFREQGWKNPQGFLRLLLPVASQLAKQAEQCR